MIMQMGRLSSCSNPQVGEILLVLSLFFYCNGIMALVLLLINREHNDDNDRTIEQARRRRRRRRRECSSTWQGSYSSNYNGVTGDQREAVLAGGDGQ